MANRRYSAIGFQATAADSILGVIGSASVTPAVYYVSLSNAETPADAAVECEVKHFTAEGTGTAVTPVPLNANSPAAVSTALSEHSAEPTYAGVVLLQATFNQRSHYQWYANQGGELVGQLAANDGIGILLIAASAGTPQVDAVMHFEE